MKAFDIKDHVRFVLKTKFVLKSGWNFLERIFDKSLSVERAFN